jgi:hypothetical protein
MLPQRRHEILDVKIFAGHHLVSASVGLMSLLVAAAAPIQFAPLSPTCFALMGPAHWLFGTRSEKKRRAFRAS